MKLAILAAVAALALSGAAIAQSASSAGPSPQTVTLKGLSGQTAVITDADLAAVPRETLEARRGDRTITYEGVSLLELLHAKVAGPWGETLTGKDLADVVLVTARDGYRVAYSIGETDPGTAKGKIVLVDRIDGKPLDDHAGPFQVVVENDLRAARSARMVASVQLVKLP